MYYEIIESFTRGKSSVEKCEDGIVCTQDYVAVVDGSTSKNDFTFNGMTTGRNAMYIIVRAIKEMPNYLNAIEVINFISNKIKSVYDSCCLTERMKINPHERFTASAAIYCNRLNKVLMVGDCQCMVDGVLYKNDKSVDKIMSEARSLYNNVEILNGKTINQLQESDNGRKFIMPFLKNQTILQNHSKSSLGYSVFDGFEVLNSKVKKISVTNASEIILASDGYPILKQTLEESEKALHYILKKDPLCINEYKSTKGLIAGNNSYDDRSYIKIKCKRCEKSTS